MDELYKNKYKIKSTRLPSWDYSDNGYYFITICVKDHICLFGKIEDGEMLLNKLGKTAIKHWLEIPAHFNNTIIDEFIVMPNHIHGILVIQNDNVKCDKHGRDEAVPRLYDGQYPQMSKISPKPKSLPVIIGSYKSIVSKTINKQVPNVNFQWQPRFYDHIIRTEESLHNIRDYIISNPAKWELDKNNPKNVNKT